MSVRRTEEAAWGPAELAVAVVGSCHHQRRHQLQSQRCRGRSAFSSAPPDGLAPAPAGSPAAAPSPERSRERDIVKFNRKMHKNQMISV